MQEGLLDYDAIILGGGIAGLMTLETLHGNGCKALLIERDALGTGQTIWSQGIIHGGLKYALGGQASAASKAIRDMPERWQQMLQGKTEPDLSNIQMRSHTCMIWADGSTRSLAGLLGARLALRTAPSLCPPKSRPAGLQKLSGRVLQVAEPVMEPQSLLQALGNRHACRMIRGDTSRIHQHEDRVSLHVDTGTSSIDLDAGHLIITAGSGSADLASNFSSQNIRVQQRPLRMVLAKGNLPILNGHCIRGTSPWLTITTVAQSSPTVWQIGGQVAESGCTCTTEETIKLAVNAVSLALPHLDFQDVMWTTYDAPRTELATDDGGRPDLPGIAIDGRIRWGWPTKLALAPLLADQLSAEVTPQECNDDILNLPRPDVATPPWEEDRSWITVHSAAPA